jgi:hypothetical protein
LANIENFTFEETEAASFPEAEPTDDWGFEDEQPSVAGSALETPLLMHEARKLAVVNGDISPEGELTALTRLQTEGEDGIRQQLVTEKQQASQDAKLQLIAEFAGRPDVAMSPQQIEDFLSPAGDATEYNSSTILEQMFVDAALSDSETAYQEHSSNRFEQEPEFDLVQRMVRDQAVWEQVLFKELNKWSAILAERNEQPELFHSLQNWIPFVQSSAMSNAQEDAGVGGDDPEFKFFTSDSLRRDADRLRGIESISERAEILRKTVEDIGKDNPTAAVAYLDAILNFSAVKKNRADLQDVVDVVDVASIFLPGAYRTVSGVARASAAMRQYTSTMADTIRRMRPNGRAADVAAVNGDIHGAAIFERLEEVRDSLRTNLNELASPEEADKFLRSLPTLMRDTFVDEVPAHLGATHLERLREGTAAGSVDLITALSDINMVQSRGFRAASVGMREALEKWDSVTPGEATNNVLSVEWHHPETGLGQSEVNLKIKIGSEGKAFTGEPELAQAEAHATAEIYGLRKGLYRVETEGENTFITITQPIDETSTAFQQALALESPTPETYGNAFLFWLKGQDGQASRIMAESAKVAQFGQNEFFRLVKEFGQRHLGSLSRKTVKRFEAFLHHQKVTPNFDDDGRYVGTGRFSVTASQFSNEWERFHGSLPDVKTIAAYRDYVALHDMQLAMQNISVHANLQRLGIEDHFFPRRRVDTTEMAVENPNTDIETPIQGKTMKPEEDHIFFGRTDDPRVLVIEPADPDLDGRANIRLMRQSEMSENEWNKLIKDYRKDAGRLVEMNALGRKAAQHVYRADVGNESVDFILSKRVQSKKPHLQQVARNPGGHVMYEEGHYVKIGAFSFTEKDIRYSGDRALFHFLYAADAKRMIPKLEEARKLYIRWRNEGSRRDITPAEVSANRARLKTQINEALRETPANFNKLDRMYRLPDDAPEGATPFADPRVPFVAVKAGQNTAEAFDYVKWAEGEGKPFRHGVGQSRLDQDTNAQFASPRNRLLDTVVGDEQAPYFNVLPSQLLSPLKTLEKSTTRIANSSFFDRFKERAIDRFLGEYGDLLQGGREAHLLNPLHTVMNAKLDEAKVKNVDLRTRQAAKRQIHIIKRVLSTESDWEKAVRQSSQRFQEWLYEEHGLPGHKLVPEAMINTLTRPDAYIRNVAFSLKMGIWNPIQLFKQSMTYNNTMAIAGPAVTNKAMPGAIQMMRLQYTRDPAIVGAFADMMENMPGPFKWKKSDFTEAFEYLRSSGWKVVGGEVGNLDLVKGASIRKGRSGAMIDTHTFFFDWGERFNRVTAYTAAYQKWRIANPNAKFTRKVGDEILNDADMMAGNMTRFSNADWQHGVFAPATQFLSYQARLTEQMLTGIGGRITRAQRARMFGLYSVMFGIPAGATVAVPWPFYDSLREEIVARYGIDPDNDYMEALTEGVAGMTASLIYGDRTTFTEEYAPGGFAVLKEIWDGDKPLFEIALGPSGSVLSDIYESTVGMRAWVANLLQNGDTGNFPMKVQDLVKIVRNATSASQAIRFLAALETGKYVNAQGRAINADDMDVFQALITALTSVEQREVGDTYKLANVNYRDKENQKQIMKLARDEWTSAMAFIEKGDEEQAVDATKRGWWWASKLTPANQKQAYTFAKQVGVLSDSVDIAYRKHQRELPNPKLTDQVKSNTELENALGIK